MSKLITDLKTGGHNYPRDQSIGNLFTGWAVSCIEMARARFRRFSGTVGTRFHDVRGGHQVKKSKMQSTEAWIEDGSAFSSTDGFVMNLERRSRIASAGPRDNFIRRSLETI